MADGQVKIENCQALADGGGLYTLTSVMFVDTMGASGSDKLSTILQGNKAGSMGGGIAGWAELNVGFGHRLVARTSLELTLVCFNILC